MNLEEGDDCFMELTFSRRWKHVSVVRTFLQSFLSVNFPEGKPTTPERVAMAVSELMENAVKYASKEGIRLSLTVSGHDPVLKVTVENPADPEAVKTVEALYQRVMTGEPLATYLQMMLEAATRVEDHSRLGLIRIRCESGCRLRLETEPELVRFTLEL